MFPLPFDLWQGPTIAHILSISFCFLFFVVISQANLLNASVAPESHAVFTKESST
jgi:hypothetical protein